jgi:hypothetical protein
MTIERPVYVRTDDGRYLVQVPDPESRFGFSLADEDQTWDGGFGIARWWRVVPENRVPKRVKERLGWLLEEGG